MSSTRWLIGTAVGVVVIAIVAVVLTMVREPEPLPGGTPEAAVQRYLQAVADGDRDAMQDTYDRELRDRCEQRDVGGPPPSPQERMSFDADLIEVSEAGDDTADVRVRITEFSVEPPFGGDGYDHTEVFRVRRSADAWRLVQVPWPYYVCPG